MKQIWIVESGEYEQQHIDLVADSPEAAELAIKNRYSDPYIVEWSSLTEDDWGFHITGNFESVPWHSTRHKATFDISAYDVHVLK